MARLNQSCPALMMLPPHDPHVVEPLSSQLYGRLRVMANSVRLRKQFTWFHFFRHHHCLEALVRSGNRIPLPGGLFVLLEQGDFVQKRHRHNLYRRQLSRQNQQLELKWYEPYR